MEKTIKFRYDGHETKRTWRFEELSDEGKPLEVSDAVIGKIYAKKALFGTDAPPKELTVTVAWE